MLFYLSKTENYLIFLIDYVLFELAFNTDDCWLTALELIDLSL